MLEKIKINNVIIGIKTPITGLISMPTLLQLVLIIQMNYPNIVINRTNKKDILFNL